MSASTSLDLEKAESYRSHDLEHTSTSLENYLDLVRTRTLHPRPSFDHALAHVETGPDVLVHFDGDNDPYKPLNWPLRTKILVTALYGLTTMGATIGTSIYSAAVTPIAHEFQVSEEVSALGVALYLFGFAVGPLLWGPCSELYGRKLSVLVPYLISAFFSIGTGAAANIQTVLVTRFFAGFFAAGPVTNTGGVLRDLWAPVARGHAMNGYVIAVYGGPTLGPVIGAALVTDPYAGWRWTEYTTAIMVLAFTALDALFIPESHGPTLLTRKAQRLRTRTGNWALHARHEEWGDGALSELTHAYLLRPVQILFTPIGAAVSTYASFVYALFYAQLAAFPILYADLRHWSPVVAALPFLALLLGVMLGAVLNILFTRAFASALLAGGPGGEPVPEARLPPMMLGGVLLTAAFFAFAWTSAPARVYWFASMPCLVVFAAGFTMVLQASLNYLIDTFGTRSASAVATLTFLRSLLAGAFPLFIPAMYGGLGPNWAGSVFAFASLALVPIPFVFYRFGRQIRASGKWSRESVE